MHNTLLNLGGKPLVKKRFEGELEQITVPDAAAELLIMTALNTSRSFFTQFEKLHPEKRILLYHTHVFSSDQSK